MNMKAYLMQKRVYGIVKGTDTMPSPGSANLRDWLKDQQAAAGYIFLGLEDAQKPQVQDTLDDPKKMWETLESIHVQKRPATRFNAYNALLNIRKEPDESLTALTAKVEKAMQDIKNTRPDKFTLDNLDQDLMCMALTRSLPPQYSSFVSSLILLPQFDFKTLKEAYILQEENDKASNQSDSISAAANFVSNNSKQSKSSNPSSNRPKCDFCSMKGHIQENCHQFKQFKAQAQLNVIQRTQLLVYEILTLVCMYV